MKRGHDRAFDANKSLVKITLERVLRSHPEYLAEFLHQHAEHIPRTVLSLSPCFMDCPNHTSRLLEMQLITCVRTLAYKRYGQNSPLNITTRYMGHDMFVCAEVQFTRANKHGMYQVVHSVQIRKTFKISYEMDRWKHDATDMTWIMYAAQETAEHIMTLAKKYTT